MPVCPYARVWGQGGAGCGYTSHHGVYVKDMPTGAGLELGLELGLALGLAWGEPLRSVRGYT